jgi:hypothetical protein
MRYWHVLLVGKDLKEAFAVDFMVVSSPEEAE